MTPTPFERLLPPRVLISQRGLLAWFWGVLGAVVLVILLLALALVVDLWIHRGEWSLKQDEVAAGAAFLGEPPANEPAPAFVTYPNTGLVPTAWRERHTWYGRLLGAAVRNVPALRNNGWATFLLLTIGVVCVLVRVASRARVRRAADDFAIASASSLRSHLHRQTLRLGPSDLEGDRFAHARSLFTTNVDAIRDGLSDWFTRGSRDLPTVGLLAVLAIVIDWRLFFLCLVPLIGCWWGVEVYRRKAVARTREADARADAALRLLSDSLQKSRLVRGYGMENFEHERFGKYLDQFTSESSAGRVLQFWSLRITRIVVASLAALMLLFVSLQVLSPTQPLSASAGFLLLATFVAATPSVSAILQLNAAREAVNSAGVPIDTYLNEIPEVGQAVGAKFLEPVSRTIIFESIGYRRGDREILKQFDLRLPAGKTTALVSMDPLLSRSVAYMLPRFIEPQSGRVLFDSEDIAWGTLDSLRAETAYVGGADPCFNGTVLENITCGEARYSVAEATDAAKLVHAHNFIQRLPKGYETVLGDRGERLDPGQAFRLGLARALLRKPALVVIEEPETPLSEDTKDLLDDAYQRIAAGRTIVFLPTRLSTVRKCDQIVLLAEGKVAAMGAHAELLKSSELYRHWEYVSFNTFRKRGGN